MSNGLPQARPTGPRGSTLAAVVVTVMIIAALAAVALPVLQGAKDADDADRTAVILISLDSSLTSNVAGVNKGACNQLANCPFFLNSLVTPVTIGMLSCKVGTPFVAADTTKWKATGPFSGYVILTGKGLKTPLGWIHDSVIRITNTSFELHIDSLTADQANYLDLAIDGVAGVAAGKLQYAERAAVFTATGQHRYSVRYIPLTRGVINC